jgi:hypothetical protein
MFAAGRSPFSLDPLIGDAKHPLIGEAKRRRRNRRAVIAVAVLLLAGLGTGLAFAFRPAGGGPTGGSPMTSYSQQDAALTVRYPAGLHLTTRNWTYFSDPELRFVLYSGRHPGAMAAGGGVTGSPSAGQVAGMLFEVRVPSRSELRRFPPRPAHFEATHLTQGVEGFNGRWQEITFRDHKRAFYLFIGVGRGGAARLPILLRALDTFRIEKRVGHAPVGGPFRLGGFP